MQKGDAPHLRPARLAAANTASDGNPRTRDDPLSHRRDRDHFDARKCHICRERGPLTPVAGGFAYVCRHCASDTETVARLIETARQAEFEPEKQLTLF